MNKIISKCIFLFIFIYIQINLFKVFTLQLFYEKHPIAFYNHMLYYNMLGFSKANSSNHHENFIY